jgi:hypothetical protein
MPWTDDAPQLLARPSTAFPSYRRRCAVCGAGHKTTGAAERCAALDAAAALYGPQPDPEPSTEMTIYVGPAGSSAGPLGGRSGMG